MTSKLTDRGSDACLGHLIDELRKKAEENEESKKTEENKKRKDAEENEKKKNEVPSKKQRKINKAKAAGTPNGREAKSNGRTVLGAIAGGSTIDLSGDCFSDVEDDDDD